MNLLRRSLTLLQSILTMKSEQLAESAEASPIYGGDIYIARRLSDAAVNIKALGKYSLATLIV